MLYSFASLIFVIAIFVIFSNEFRNLFKKIFAYKIAQIVLPLALASFLICVFDYWVLWALYFFLDCLKGGLSLLTKIMPFQYAAHPMALILLLTLTSLLPVILLNVYFTQKKHKPYQYPYTTSLIIWLVTAMVLMAN